MNAKVFVRRITSIVLFFLILGGLYLSFAPITAVADGGGNDPIMIDSTISVPSAPADTGGDLDFLVMFAVLQAVL